MKKMTVFFLVLLLCVGCDGKAERIIVKQYEVKSELEGVDDIMTPKVVTEIATQIVKGKVLSLVKTELNPLGVFTFSYRVRVEEILFDAEDRLNDGEKIEVISSKGLLPVSDAVGLFESKGLTHDLPLTGNKKNDYVLQTQGNSIPLEAGGTYYLYLRAEGKNGYRECGWDLLYRLKGDQAISGTAEGERTEPASDAEKRIRELIASREGLDDGFYLSDLIGAYKKEHEEDR